MPVKNHTWGRRFLHVPIGRPSTFFLWRGDADVCTPFFTLILILPCCPSLKFFSFNFSAATHILIGTLCLRRDSGIGVSTQFNSLCGGFGVCLVFLLWLVVMVAVLARGGNNLPSFSSFFLYFFLFLFSLILKWGRFPLCFSFFFFFFHPVACLLKQELWLLLESTSSTITGLALEAIILLLLWLLHAVTWDYVHPRVLSVRTTAENIFSVILNLLGWV